MTAYEFLQRYGKPRAEVVAKRAKTKYVYFSHLAYGHRRPSPEMAERLVKASDGELTLIELLFPPTKTRRREKAAA